MRTLRGVPAALALALTLGVSTMSGCTSPPAVDPEAAQEWLRAAQHSSANEDDVIGSFAGTTSRTSDDGMILSFAQPVTVAGFEVACFGGGSAEFGYSLTGEGVGIGLTAPVECDEQPTLIDTGIDGAAKVSGVSSVAVRVTRTDSATTFTVGIVGTAPDG